MVHTLRDRALLLVLTGLVLAPVHGPLLADSLRFYPDLASAYPLHELAEPGLYEGDHFREMVLSFGFPPGYRWALWPFAQLLPLLLALKVMSVLMSAAVVQLAFGFAPRVHGRWPVALAMLALVVVMDSMHGAYPRAWGMGFTVLLVLLLAQRRAVAAAVVAVVSILFYPMVFPVAAVALGGWILWRGLRERGPWWELALVAALLLGGLGLALWRSAVLAGLAGAPCTPADCADAPELFAAGNYTFSAYRGRWLLNSLLNLGEHPPSYPWVLGLLLPVAVVQGILGWLRLHAATWLLLAGLGACAAIELLNHIVSLPTGYASRALIFTLPVAAAAGWGLLVARAAPPPGHPAPWPRRLAWLALCGTPIVPALGTFDLGHVSDDHGRLAPAFEAIGALPADAVVGGHPVTVNPVPLLTARRVEIIAAAFNPWMQDWWREYKRRAHRALDTFYAPSDDLVRQGCVQGGSTHLLVEPERFAPEHATRPGELDWEPMASHIRDLAGRGPFALQRRAPRGTVCLLDCSTLEGPCWRVFPLDPPPPSPMR